MTVETVAQEIERLKREIAQRQGRLAALVLGDQRQGVTCATPKRFFESFDNGDNANEQNGRD
jgi:hypothetical protein